MLRAETDPVYWLQLSTPVVVGEKPGPWHVTSFGFFRLAQTSGPHRGLSCSCCFVSVCRWIVLSLADWTLRKLQLEVRFLSV